MKKAILSILLVIASLTAFAQNWVEVGVDSQYGEWFRTSDVFMIDESDGYLIGHSYLLSSGNFKHRYSLLKTSDGGLTWDSVRVLNSVTFSGNFFQFNFFQNQLSAISLIRRPSPNPLNPFQASFGLFEDIIVAGEFDTLISFASFPINNYMVRLCPINDSIIILAMERHYSYHFEFESNGYSYIARYNKRSGDFEPSVIDLPDTIEFIYEIFFTNELNGYVVGGSNGPRVNGYLFFTTDGGLSWGTMKQAQLGVFNCVKFYNQQTGILGGEEGLYFTRNGGFDWFPAIGISSRFNAVDIALVGNVAYAIGSFDYYEGSAQRYKTQIYKSLDQGKEWCLVFEDTLETVDASAKTMHISFSDENHGVAAYGYNRLIYTTNGGGLTECITGINEAENELLVNIYPNPSNGTFTVDVPNTILVDNLSIYDLSGRVVFQSATESSSVLVNGLSSGMYILQVQTSEGVHTQKVIVE